jgi:hypothetical protein
MAVGLRRGELSFGAESDHGAEAGCGEKARERASKQIFACPRSPAVNGRPKTRYAGKPRERG